MKNVYMDNAATTRLYPNVLNKMTPFLTDIYANPNSSHIMGKYALNALNTARTQLARTLGAEPDEIIFTSGGTESNNLALKGLAKEQTVKKHIITSLVEHNAIINVCEDLQKDGYEVTYITPDKEGKIPVWKIEKAIRNDTFLISIMYANNEVGTIMDIKEIGYLARRNGIYFHTDAVAAFGHVPINVCDENIDLLSASSHKFGGPKGAGFLYVRRGIKLHPIILGGSQEAGLRAGTQNVPGAVGTAAAAEISLRNMRYHSLRTASLRDRMIQKVLREIPGARLNGCTDKRLPGNVHFCFRGISSSNLIQALNSYGIYVSSGSACKSASNAPSRVLLAMGYTESEANGAVRFTLSDELTTEDIDYCVDVLKRILL